MASWTSCTRGPTATSIAWGGEPRTRGTEPPPRPGIRPVRGVRRSESDRCEMMLLRKWLRRTGPFVPLSVAGFLLLGPGSAVPSSAPAAGRLVLEVRETGGLARGGYPAHALLKLPKPVPPETKVRLLQAGKPV